MTANNSLHYDRIKTNWLACLPSGLADCFEVKDELNIEPKRITGLVYRPSAEFIKEINKLKADNNLKKNAQLCWVMAIDDSNQFSPYFELRISNPLESIRLESSGVLNTIYYQKTFAFAKKHKGVTPNYRNEICLNWGALPYSNFPDIFYTSVHYPDFSDMDKKENIPLEMPQRLRECIIPFSDFAVLADDIILNPNALIIVHLGISNLISGQYGVPFNPIIEVLSNPKGLSTSDEYMSFDDGYAKLIESDETESTDLDFVFYCPPNCPG
ncbi:hypothetical protein BFP71_10260 [Roseivirga misakiensis]|uniref:Uncharacterized protein n=2 Tax=Roseivirga misakiensis TaxID=1563681 RepID=A0A1E5SLC1_9BACT|nr:hypothetical protein BFP71_10260 [Roseivirga misakiensis]